MREGVALLTVAEAGDAQEVRELMAHVIRTSVTQEPGLLQATLDNVNRNVDWWLARPGECVHLKATAGGRIVAVVLVKEFWNLCSLFVDPDFQGEGIGRALVEAACVACRDRSPKNAIWLNAATNAVPFYRHLGFVERESARVLPEGFLAMEKAF